MSTSLMVDELDQKLFADGLRTVSAEGTTADDAGSSDARHRRESVSDPSCPVPDPDLKRRRLAEADVLRGLLARVADGDTKSGSCAKGKGAPVRSAASTASKSTRARKPKSRSARPAS